MDDEDDEIESQSQSQSHPSPSPRSESPPPNGGRITVTVAAAAPPPPNNTLTLALPIQQQQQLFPPPPPPPQPHLLQQRIGNGGGREDCWSEAATAVLIDAWGERYLELSRGNLKQKHWKEVADIVSSREHFGKIPKTDIQCKNRIDTVKKKYKSEKAKISSASAPSNWPFYHTLDQLIGPSAKPHSSPALSPPFLPKPVPMGIPVGVRSLPYYKQQHQQQQKRQIKRRVPLDSDSSQSDREPSPHSTDSFPPETTYEPIPKRPRFLQPHREMNLRPVAQLGWKGKDKQKDKNFNANHTNVIANAHSDWGTSVRELTRAILKFGEAYEQAETSKLQQLADMEKQRMKFAKELELQRMQFFIKTQLEISQLKPRRDGGGGGNTSNNHHLNNNINNSDSSN